MIHRRYAFQSRERADPSSSCRAAGPRHRVAAHSAAARSIPGVSENFSADRDRPDACPGALRLHQAADGGLARIRVPGGRLDSRQLRALNRAAVELGNSTIELTSRANLQLRGIEAPDELGRLLDEVGLLPSLTHERVRNIVAAPHAGLDGRGRLDSVRWLVTELDARLCADPALAELSGRFLFTVDDGSGDLSRLCADVGLLPVSAGSVAVLLAGSDSGLRVRPDDAPSAAVIAAREFLAVCHRHGGAAWRVAELDTQDELVEALCASCGRWPGAVVDVTSRERTPPARQRNPQERPTVGELGRSEGRVGLGVGAPLGRLSPAQLRSIIRTAEAASGVVRLTPWRTVVVPGVDEGECSARLSELHSCGLIVETASPFNGATACAGKPGCAKSLADVHRDAARGLAYVEAVGDETAEAGVLPVHWAGCSRRCGRPPGPAVEVLASPSGYSVSSTTESGTSTWVADAGHREVAEAVRRARHAGTTTVPSGTGHENNDQETGDEDYR
ncbi:precorrin-3B synthase [Actinopolyspora erythraea]|uniref:Precorrin-3B synthase n=1 Tax=Actinopolyspora erythraea TaxID=414996 RepID=A0A223RQN4_9ACTN|nr:precorrin-3B synthase [Actinopolyspora erythraea]